MIVDVVDELISKIHSMLSANQKRDVVSAMNSNVYNLVLFTH